MPITEAELTTAINDTIAVRNACNVAIASLDIDRINALNTAAMLGRLRNQLFPTVVTPPPIDPGPINPPPIPPIVVDPGGGTSGGTNPISPASRWNKLVVQFAPTDDVSGNPVWVDVTDRVEVVKWKRGRTDELTPHSAGTGQITLRNDDHLFSPLNTAGQWYTKLKPKRPFRIRSTYDNVDHFFFTAYPKGFPVDNRYLENRTYVDVRIEDAFSILANAKVDHSAYTVISLKETLKPTVWFRMNDELNQNDQVWTAADVSGNGRDTTYLPRSVPKFVDGNINGKAFSPNGVNYLELNRSDVIKSNNRVSIEFWFKADGLPSVPQSRIIMGNTDFEIGVGAAGSSMKIEPGAIYATFLTSRNGIASQFFYQVFSDGRNLCDDRWHYIVFTFSGSNFVCYIDGELNAIVGVQTGYTWALQQTDKKIYIGRGDGYFKSVSTGLYDKAAIHNVAFYDGVMSNDTVKRKWDGAIGWPGDLTGQRINRILDLIGWPVQDRQIAPGTFQVSSQPALSGAALAAIQEVVRAEPGGQFYADAVGRLLFLDREYTSTYEPAKPSGIVLGDRPFGLSTEFPYVEVIPQTDDEYIFNAATVSRRDGATYTVENTISSKEFYRRNAPDQTDLLFAYDLYAKFYAEWIVFTYSQPRSRIQEVTVESRPGMLNKGLEDLANFFLQTTGLNSYITVKRRYSATVVWEITGLVDQMEHTINFRNRSWKATYKISPLPQRVLRLTDPLSSNYPLGL